jgi:citrate lyase subunit beta / citryl-CoA lyase
VITPLRSALYVPASNPKALAKLPTLKCDAVIFDLEDAVAPDAKAQAREQLKTHYQACQPGPMQLCIRVNRYTTPWYADDIKLAAQLGPDVVVLPKAESAEEIHHAAHDLFMAGCTDRTKLWALVETPKGVLAAATLASGSPKLAALVLGLNDLAKDLQAELTPDRQALLYAMSAVLLAARAQGLLALDGVYPDLKDAAGFEQQCAQARALGFDGKTLIHPDQIPPANRIFGPTHEAIRHAEKICAAWRADAHKGVTVVDGQMIEALHLQQAERTLALAQAILERS